MNIKYYFLRRDNFNMNKFRACLLVSRVVIIENDKVLLVKHQIGDDSAWIFPGGRVEENETTVDAAIRECKEETGYDIKVNGVCYLQEFDIYYVTYFNSTIIGGNLIIGSDPDISKDKQIIKDVKWIDICKLNNYEVYPENLAKLIYEGFNNNYINVPDVYINVLNS